MSEEDRIGKIEAAVSSLFLAVNRLQVLHLMHEGLFINISMTQDQLNKIKESRAYFQAASDDLDAAAEKFYGESEG